MSELLEGVLPVHKPAGFTSHDVVAKARRLLRERRIGHTGTLDPDVTGVLPLCIGKATRIVEYLQELPKEYEAELTIGYATDTEDSSGAVLTQLDQVELDEETFRAALNRFVGVIEQTPPMYSAVKVNGKRLYELAREGVVVERASRQATIHDIQLLSFDSSTRYPKALLRVRCSKGTYIRTLCVDIGKSLGYPAVMSKLIRTETSGIPLSRCYTLEEIEQLTQDGKLEAALIPVEEAISYLPSVRLSADLVIMARNGMRLPVAGTIKSELGEQSLVRVFIEQDFIGIYRLDSEEEQLLPVKVFSTGR